ncbi:DUF932 domain-containing protein [Micrococcales bacterium 31B]|nr:DUF932 domain-containing protein [Micrococcales bacterium 31B]
MTTLLAPTTPTAARRSAFALGVDVSAAQSATEALTLAGLDWQTRIIAPEAVTMTSADGVTEAAMPEHLNFAVRSDTSAVLGVVGRRYIPVQNSQMAEVADYARGLGGFLTRAGSFAGGSRVFMDLQFPDLDVKVAHMGSEIDHVVMGLRLTNAHDGTGQFVATVTGRRLACLNGMVVPVQGLSHTFKIRHTASAIGLLGEAERSIAGLMSYVVSFAKTAYLLLDTPMSAREFGHFIDELYPAPVGDISDRELGLLKARRLDLSWLFTEAETNAIGRGTAWGALNAVTEYVDWVAPLRAMRVREAAVARAMRQFNGLGQEAKDRATRLLLAFSGGD